MSTNIQPTEPSSEAQDCYEQQHIDHHCIEKQYAKELNEEECDDHSSNDDMYPSYADCYPDPWADDYQAIIDGKL